MELETIQFQMRSQLFTKNKEMVSVSIHVSHAIERLGHCTWTGMEEDLILISDDSHPYAWHLTVSLMMKPCDGKQFDSSFVQNKIIY